MGIEETAETWVRVDLFCDGLGNDGICLLGANDQLERISDVAPTSEGAQKAIRNAAVKARWCFDQKLQRWLCPACARAHGAFGEPENIGVTTNTPPSVPQRDRVLQQAF